MGKQVVASVCMRAILALAALMVWPCSAVAQDLPGDSIGQTWEPDIPELPFDAKEIAIKAEDQSTIDLVREVAVV